ncbi:MAG: acyl carrier protein [Planctomycetes bacterium]|nr:acyl carrier protein [Planctomycetota bacterium]
MTRAELLQHLEKLVEAQPGTLTGPEELAALAGWDSLTQVNYVLVVERATGIRPSASRVAACRTVQDLIDLFDASKEPRTP